CGRSFEPLNPHHFSFNSPLGWCPACEGLGSQKGANPAVLIRDSKLSLREGAIAAWPILDDKQPFTRFAAALGREGGFSLDTTYEKLTPKQHRLLLYGSGDKWITLEPSPTPGKRGPARRKPAGCSFQYKGVMPALTEAARVSFIYRHKLDYL